MEAWLSRSRRPTSCLWLVTCRLPLRLVAVEGRVNHAGHGRLIQATAEKFVDPGDDGSWIEEQAVIRDAEAVTASKPLAHSIHVLDHILECRMPGCRDFTDVPPHHDELRVQARGKH